MNYSLFSLALLTYLWGAVPFSLVVSKLKKVDLRKVGSGNIGATNVYRAMGFKFAFLVFFLSLFVRNFHGLTPMAIFES